MTLHHCMYVRLQFTACVIMCFWRLLFFPNSRDLVLFFLNVWRICKKSLHFTCAQWAWLQRMWDFIATTSFLTTLFLEYFTVTVFFFYQNWCSSKIAHLDNSHTTSFKKTVLQGTQHADVWVRSINCQARKNWEIYSWDTVRYVEENKWHII